MLHVCCVFTLLQRLGQSGVFVVLICRTRLQVAGTSLGPHTSKQLALLAVNKPYHVERLAMVWKPDVCIGCMCIACLGYGIHVYGMRVC